MVRRRSLQVWLHTLLVVCVLLTQSPALVAAMPAAPDTPATPLPSTIPASAADTATTIPSLSDDSPFAAPSSAPPTPPVRTVRSMPDSATASYLSPMVFIQTDVITPGQLTVNVQTTVLFVNTTSEPISVTIGIDPTSVTSGPQTVYLPLVAQSTAGMQTAAENQAPTTEATAPATPQADAPLPEPLTLALQPGQTQAHTFAVAGVYTIGVEGKPTLSTTITVRPRPSQPPDARNVQLTTHPGEQVPIELKHLAFSNNPSSMVITMTTSPTYGTATLTDDTLTYTAADDYTGLDTMTYVASNAHGTAAGQIDIQIEPINALPFVDGRIVHVVDNTPIKLELGALTSDPDGDPLTFSLDTPPEYGDASLNGSTLTYTPTATMPYTDGLYYRVSDTPDEIDTEEQDARNRNAIIFVAQPLAATGNNAPLAGDRTITTYANEPLTLDMTTLASDPEGDALTFALGDFTDADQASIDGSTFRYTPTLSGTTVFRYTATDTAGASSEGRVLVNVLTPPAPEPTRLVNRDQPVALVIEPRSVLFTTVGETQPLKLHAYNTLGEEIPIDDNVQWSLLSWDSAQSIEFTVDPNDPTRAEVRSTASVGYLQLSAHWRSIQASSMTASAVELHDGVVMIPDTALNSGVALSIPPELRDLPEDQRQSWIRANADTLHPHYRVVVDESQMDTVPSVDSLVATGGDIPVFGRVVDVQPIAGGTELIYTTAPITHVLKAAEFHGFFGREDALLEEAQFEPEEAFGDSTAGGLQGTALGSTDLVAAVTGGRSPGLQRLDSAAPHDLANKPDAAPSAWLSDSEIAQLERNLEQSLATTTSTSGTLNVKLETRALSVNQAQSFKITLQNTSETETIDFSGMTLTMSNLCMSRRPAGNVRQMSCEGSTREKRGFVSWGSGTIGPGESIIYPLKVEAYAVGPINLEVVVQHAGGPTKKSANLSVTKHPLGLLQYCQLPTIEEFDTNPETWQFVDYSDDERTVQSLVTGSFGGSLSMTCEKTWPIVDRGTTFGDGQFGLSLTGELLTSLTLNVSGELYVNIQAHNFFPEVRAEMLDIQAEATIEVSGALRGELVAGVDGNPIKLIPDITLARLPVFPMLGIKFKGEGRPVVLLTVAGELTASASKVFSFEHTWERDDSGAQGGGEEPGGSENPPGEGGSENPLDEDETEANILKQLMPDELTVSFTGEAHFTASYEMKLTLVVGVIDVNTFRQKIANWLGGGSNAPGGQKKELTGIQRWISEAVNAIPDPTINFETLMNVPLLVADHISASSVTRTGDDSSSTLLPPTYGHGRYGYGVGVAMKIFSYDPYISFLWGGTVLFDKDFITGYPGGQVGAFSPDEDEDDDTPPLHTWCTRNGPKETYEDEYVRIECKQETTECPSGFGGTQTEYYRKVTYLDGIIRRSYVFTDSLLTETIGPQINDLDVRLVERQTESTGCTVEKAFEQVGTTERQGNVDHWRWWWNKNEISESGIYTMTGFTNPRHFGLDLFYWHIYRHIDTYDSDQDTFSITVGDTCGQGQEWELADVHSNCWSLPELSFIYLGPRRGVSGGTWKLGPCWGDCSYEWRKGWWDFSWLQNIRLSRSWGDPHITTIDGSSYSTMHMGEYVYVKDQTNDFGSIFSKQDGSLELQVRHQRLPNFPDWAAFNTAAAVRAGGHIFEVRLPENALISDDLELLIDGEVTTLPPDTYQIDDAIFEVTPGNGLVVWYREPDFAGSDTYVNGNFTRVRISAVVDDELLHAVDDEMLDEPAVSLTIDVSAPPTGRYHGMLGTFDDISGNDIRDPHGNTVRSLDAFYESWRVKTESQSLFTYEEGEGVDTFYDVQTTAPPTTEELEANGYVRQATNLLANTCGADVEAISATFIEAVALELAAGRSERNLLASGICFDQRVNGAGQDATPFVGFSFKGHVMLEQQPEIPISGARVTIRVGETGKLLCDTVSLLDGRYKCSLSDYPDAYADLETLTLQYRVSGRGEPVEYSRTITTPQPGEMRDVLQDFTMSPDNVLRLTGRLYGPDGLPLPNGRIRFHGPDNFEREVDETGSYEFYIALPTNVQTGEMFYEATDADFETYTSLKRFFSLTGSGIHEIEQDLHTELDDIPNPAWQPERRLLFTGKVENTLLPDGTDSGVGGLPVIITGAGIVGGSCETTAEPDGSYSCRALINTDEAFDATISVAGVAAQNQTVTVSEEDIPSPGSVLSKEINIQVSPTTLEINGQVITAASAPVPNAHIQVSSPEGTDGLVAHASARAADDGTYTVYLVLPDTAPQTDGRFTGDLRFDVEYDAPPGADTPGMRLLVDKFDLATLSGGGAAPNVLTQVSMLLMNDGHTIAFAGQVQNSLVAGLAVPGADVTISSPTLGEICKTISDEQGFYSCDFFIPSNAPATIEYAVGGRGQLATTATLDPTGAQPGGRFPFEQALEVSPTTMQISGIVRDEHSDPVAGATVGVAARNGSGTNTKTNAAGEYTVYVTLDNGVRDDLLSFNVLYTSLIGSASSRTETIFDVEVNTLNTLTKDLEIELGDAGLDPALVSRYSISGEVRNGHTGTSIPGAAVEMRGAGADADLGTLCETVANEAGRYVCDGALINETPLEVELIVSYRGAEIGRTNGAFEIIPGAQFVRKHTRDLVVNPTTIKMHGVVNNLEGMPLPNATVRTTSPDKSSITTNAEGEYELYLIVPNNRLDGNVAYTASIGNIEVSGQQSYSGLAAGKLNQLPAHTIELPYAARFVMVEGTVTNHFDATASRGILVKIGATGLGTLCETVTKDLGAYSCKVALPDDTLRTLRFTVAGLTTDPSGAPYEMEVGTEERPLPPSGGTFTHAYDMDVEATTVQLSGVVSADGSPVAGATVKVEGRFIAETTTGSDGSYTIAAAVRTDQPASNIIKVEASASGPDRLATRELTLNLSPNSLHEYSADLPMVTIVPDKGIIYVVGQVVYEQTPGVYVPVEGARVNVTSAQEDCSIARTWTRSDGIYFCTIYIDETTTAPIDLTIEVSDRGSATATATINDIPELGSVTTVNQDIVVEPTGLHLSGTISDNSGTPLGEAVLTIAPYGGRIVTNVDGTYDVYVLLRDRSYSGTFEYLATHDLGSEILVGDTTRPFSVEPGEILEVPQDMTLIPRPAYSFLEQTHNSGNSSLWGDLNNDGMDDNILYDSDSDSFTYYLSDGTGNFQSGTVGSWSDVHSDRGLIDYDNDGWMDIYYVSDSDGRYILLHNDGAIGPGGTLQFTKVETQITREIHFGGETVLWEDFDQDGYPDLLLLTDDVSQLTLYRNNAGSGTFTLMTTNLPDMGSFYDFFALDSPEAAWGDYDNDGDLDLLLSGSEREGMSNVVNFARVYRNDGTDGTTVTLTDIGAGLESIIGYAKWLDYDRDGWLDIYLNGCVGTYSSCVDTVGLYHNSGVAGGFTFTDEIAGSGIEAAYGSTTNDVGRTVEWADYNRDGYPDLVQARYDAGIHLYQNDGDGTFSDVTSPVLPTQVGSNDDDIGWVRFHDLVWVDYNGDSYPDIYVYARRPTGSSTILRLLLENEGPQ